MIMFGLKELRFLMEKWIQPNKTNGFLMEKWTEDIKKNNLHA